MDYNEIKPKIDKFHSLSTEEQIDVMLEVVEAAYNPETTKVQYAELKAFAIANLEVYEKMVEKDRLNPSASRADRSKEVVPPLERVMLIYNHCKINELTKDQIHEGFAALLGRSDEFKEGFRLGILELYDEYKDNDNFKYIAQHLGIITEFV
jgi:hypothetical protein